jgi:hypothetical protein
VVCKNAADYLLAVSNESSEGRPVTKSRVLLQVIVWGEQYLSDFMEVSLPSLLAPGNFPDVVGRTTITFQIVSNSAGIEILQGSLIIHRLQSLVTVDFVNIEGMSEISGNKYDLVTHYQLQSLARLGKETMVVFSYPDFIWGAGSLSHLVGLIEGGGNAIFTFIPYASAEAVTLRLVQDSKYYTFTEHGPVLDMANRDLARFVLEYPNQGLEGFMWEGTNYNFYPAYLSWRVGKLGLYAKCFHMHPIALKVCPEDIRVLERGSGTLDTSVIEGVVRDLAGVRVITDSDSFAVSSLRHEFEPPFKQADMRPSIENVAKWTDARATNLNWHLFHHGVAWRGEETDREAWRQVREKADDVAARIESLGNIEAPGVI